jgi:nitrogen fixation protein FixH
MRGKLSGRQVLAIFAACFAVIFAVNFAMAWFAISTFSGEVDHAPPPAGSKMLQYPVAQAAAPVRVARDGERVHIALTGAPLADEIEAGLSRPVTTLEDRPLALSRAADGGFDATLEGVPSGQWDLIVKYRETATGRMLSHKTRLLLP